MAWLDGVLLLLHLLAAMAWLGGSLFLVTRFGPAMRAAGPAGIQVGLALERKGGLTPFFAPASVVAVVTGALLYVRVDRHVDAFATTGSTLLTLGAACGLAGFLVGLLVSSPAEAKLKQIARRVEPGEAPSPEDAEAFQAAMTRASLASHMILGLVLLATLGMAAARIGL
ncbi:MAG: hypothetical protein ACPGQL_05100 [Thermoplasmatota archaeon]